DDFLDSDETGSWPCSCGCRTSSFSPRATIATPSPARSTSGAEPSVRTRLRTLPVIYVLILAMATCWRCAFIRDGDVLLHYVDATVIAPLGGVFALLASRRPLSPAWLGGLELATVGLCAGRVAVVQYRLMLLFSLRDDPMMAERIMKNIVLL